MSVGLSPINTEDSGSTARSRIAARSSPGEACDSHSLAGSLKRSQRMMRAVVDGVQMALVRRQVVLHPQAQGDELFREKHPRPMLTDW